MKITKNSIRKRQRAQFDICKKPIKCETFLYTKIQTFFKNKTISVTFLYTTTQTINVTRLSGNFWSWHLYKKRIKLCVTWRIYIQKAIHFAKRKIIFFTCFCTKILTLCVIRFSCNFWGWRRGGKGYMQKTMHFASHFYMQKIMHFLSRCYIQKINHFSLT